MIMELEFKEGDWAAYNWLTEPDSNGKQEDNWKIGRIVKINDRLMYLNDDNTDRCGYMPITQGVKLLSNEN